MTDFPTMVYRSPGFHRASGGKSFDYRSVESADDLKEAMAHGWRLSLTDAIEATKAQSVIAEVIEAQEAIDDVSPATRDELEQKARKLGVGFNSRTSDTVLAQRIAKAI